MSLSSARKASLCFGLLSAISTVAFAQTNYYAPNGAEYAVAGSLAGDQMFPDAAVSPAGGFVVWQDNVTDGDGWGVSAMRLNGSLSGSGGSFRVNVHGAGDQEHPHVALLKNGGAVFVWQGGPPSFQHIYARFLSPSNTFLTANDVLVNASTNNFQVAPAVAVLTNGNVVIVWASYDEAGSNSLLDVYGRIFSPAGQPLTGEFLINQFIAYNQRTPAVAALANGGFVVAWVSEQERSTAPNWVTNSTYYTAASMPRPSADIYARLFDGGGNPQIGEFLVNADSNPAANPAATAATDGSYMVAWDAHDMTNPTNSWDIYARSFTNAAGGPVTRVNTHVYGDQYVPRLCALGTDYLVAWTSLGQDGDREGVFGQFLRENGSPAGVEFRVNTTALGQQMQPVVVSDGAEQFLAAWTSFTFSPSSFDLFAQRYDNVAAVLPPMGAPFVYAPFVLSNNVYQPELEVSWPSLLGISVSNYEIYVDGSATPMALIPGTANRWIMTAANGLTNNSTHSFALDYVTTDGRRSPISPPAGGATWSGYNWGGIPWEWMQQYYGSDMSKWPAAGAALAAGGPTLAEVFLSGGNPLDSGTWLKTQLENTPEGLFLSWNPEPGYTYQVQVSTNLNDWSNLGAPRFAADNTDSIYVGKGSAGYYRLVLLRQ
ncbi:MAG: hypothetical protein KGJ60_04515 [Verrucomicrobiota bacterium]|nr:hypothetical protein [Verrucomicrobiota bacterium]